MSAARVAAALPRSAPLARRSTQLCSASAPTHPPAIARIASPAVSAIRLRSLSRSAASAVSVRSAVTSSSPLADCADMYTVEERGSLYSPNYRVFIKDENGPISAMHDIPLWADRARREAHMVVEVPRWSNAKMEISLGEKLNPIKQDVKKGAMRFVGNVFPHHGYMWNYGALPQTWEDPRHVEPSTNARGDNDPIDVVEIGQRVAARGDVLRVKLLGALALIDEGETDWKLVAVDVRDPDAARLRDVADVEALFPGLLRATVEWFRLYKVPDGKPPNRFAFDGEAKDAAFAHRVVDEVHEFWRRLVSGDAANTSEISLMNVTGQGQQGVEREAAARVVAEQPALEPAQPVLPAVHKWHFVSGL